MLTVKVKTQEEREEIKENRYLSAVGLPVTDLFLREYFGWESGCCTKVNIFQWEIKDKDAC